MDDYELAKLSLAKKVRDLCLQFLRDTGKDRIYLEVRPSGDMTMTFDTQGKTCVGASHEVQVIGWTEDEFREFLEQGVPHYIDDYDDDE